MDDIVLTVVKTYYESTFAIIQILKTLKLSLSLDSKFHLFIKFNIISVRQSKLANLNIRNSLFVLI